MSVAPEVSSWWATQASSPSLVGSIVCLPCSRTCLIASLIHSVCCDRQVVMLHSAAEGARGTAVVSRLG
jgi:hypothetical protein